jgi:hypothetical protein
MREEQQVPGTQAPDGTVLLGSINRFVAAVNGNVRVKKILQGWNPTITVRASDTDEQIHFCVTETVLSAAVPGAGRASHLVTLEATQETLRKVFTGTLNPVRANLDGELAVFASDRDNVKLDAVCMVLWGM